jgi:hypothetical protein
MSWNLASNGWGPTCQSWWHSTFRHETRQGRYCTGDAVRALDAGSCAPRRGGALTIGRPVWLERRPRVADALPPVCRVVIGVEGDDAEEVTIAIRDRADLLAQPQRIGRGAVRRANVSNRFPFEAGVARNPGPTPEARSAPPTLALSKFSNGRAPAESRAGSREPSPRPSARGSRHRGAATQESSPRSVFPGRSARSFQQP